MIGWNWEFKPFIVDSTILSLDIRCFKHTPFTFSFENSPFNYSLNEIYYVIIDYITIDYIIIDNVAFYNGKIFLDDTHR